MADFCSQCSLENFGEDYDDFATRDPKYLGDFRHRWQVICEGCGPECIVVWNGLCVSETCLKKHGLEEKGT